MKGHSFLSLQIADIFSSEKEGHYRCDYIQFEKIDEHEKFLFSNSNSQIADMFSSETATALVVSKTHIYLFLVALRIQGA